MGKSFKERYFEKQRYSAIEKAEGWKNKKVQH